MADDGIVLREPVSEDGVRLHKLVSECKPLDENSVYCNLLQCSHFSQTCCVAEKDGSMVGFVTGYLHPKEEGVYFLWQVGVHPDAAGHGLGKRMMKAILAREVCRGVHTLHTTITKDNKASRGLFGSFARDEGAEMTEEDFFTEKHFGDTGKDPEYLFRIGPLSTPPK
jgi:L-2,4-diaminobutyric acid acetyltransferase